MKIAVITPTPLLEDYASLVDSYHLVLAHHVHKSAKYAEYYRRKSEEGHFVILDNSAHELGEAPETRLLVEAAKQVKASEIALPDRVFFGDDTLRESQEAIEIFRKELPGTPTMGIPQGRTPSEFFTCFEGLRDLEIDTIGLSKDYEVWPGGLISLVQEMRHRGLEVPIHLLGWGRDLQQLYKLGEQSEVLNLRGCDSAKPIVYAAAGIRLPVDPEEPSPEYPRRSPGFFSLTRIEDWISAVHNINVFKLWACGGKKV